VPLGVCKLCLQERELVRSHLLPATTYKYLRAGAQSPIRMAHGVALPSDRQTQEYLLCEECEDILNKGGESWLTPLLATIQRTFPFYDLLTKVPRDYSEPGFDLYFTATNPAIEVEKITHFALGIFWKASVHSWSGTKKEPPIQLGPYSEMLRKWLRGDAILPDSVALSVYVLIPSRAQIVSSEPYKDAPWMGIPIS
jgi:hypothetical protein